MEVASCFGPEAYEARPLRGSGDDAGLTRMKEAKRRLKDRPNCERCRSRRSTVAVGEARGYVAICDACNRTEKLDREERSTRPASVRTRPPTTRSPRTLTRPSVPQEPDPALAYRRWLQPAVKGLAAPFGQVAVLPDGRRERISPGAFRVSLQHDRPHLRVNHDAGWRPPGRLDLWETDEGLRVVFAPDSDDLRRHLKCSIGEGRFVGFSIGGRVTKSHTAADGVRVVDEFRLSEISLVQRGLEPAYKGSYVLAVGAWV